MKKITLLSCFLMSSFSFGQVNVNESFESQELWEVPQGWTSSGEEFWGMIFSDVFVSDEDSCTGSNSIYTNLYSSQTSAYIISPTYSTTSDAMLVSYSIKLIDYDTELPVDYNFGTINLQYSVDDGTTWSSLGVLNGSNYNSSTSCVMQSFSIPQNILSSGGSIKFKFDFSWLVNDFNIYIDDFVVQQIPNVSTLDCATNIVSNSGVECTNGTATISWNSVSNAVGYKVSVGTSPNTYNVISDQITYSTSYVVTNLNPDVTYYYKVVPTTTIVDATGCVEQMFTTPDISCVCTPSYNSTGEYSDYISNITTTGATVNLNNPTGTDANNYSDFTNLDFQAEAGSEITFNMEYSFGSTSYVSMWIDWNNDNILSESERVVPKQLMAGYTHSFTYTIPENAEQGNYRVRLRTVYDYYGEISLEPCENYGYGETEDYLLQVSALVSTVELDLVNLKIYPNPTKDVLNISYNDLISKVTIFDLSGRQIFDKEVNDLSTVVSTDNLSKGTYLLKVQTQKGESSIVKFIKK